MEEFFLPFGGRLRKDNRWVQMANMIPWDHVEGSSVVCVGNKQPAMPAVAGADAELQALRWFVWVA